jgi:hypothetical protein
MLSVTWLICEKGAGRNYYPRDMTYRFVVFWRNIGVFLCPSHDQYDWPVTPLAMISLFVLPIFIWWAIKPIITPHNRRDVNR